MQYHWKKHFYKVALICLPYIIAGLGMAAIVFLERKIPIFLVVGTQVNCFIITIIEYLQIQILGFGYYCDIHNNRDFFGIVVCYNLFASMFYVVNINGKVPKESWFLELILFVSCSFGIMRGLLAFCNLFQETRFIKSMLIRITKKLYPFLFVYGCVNIFFAFIFSILSSPG